MTPKEALEYLENRVSKLAINHKIGNRNIANLEIKDIVAGIETHVIPAIEIALNEHEALKKDVVRLFELNDKPFELTTDEDFEEMRTLEQELRKKVGKEE